MRAYVFSRDAKHQIPSTKLQISSNDQNSNFQKKPIGNLELKIGICLEFGI
jgi:hypothetical protein